MIAYNYTGQPTKSRLENRIKFHVINPGELVWPDGVSKEFDNNDLISGKDPGQGLVEVFQYPTQFFTYTYDDWGRLLTITHRCEDNLQVTLVDNEYDHLGRLCANKRNGNPNLRTDYDYNIRSWTKSLSGSLFSQTLYYQDDYARTQTSSHFNTPSYSGNISAMKWTVAGDRVDNRAYAFDYDALSRLTSAAYFENDVSANHYATSYSYDKNTNLTKIYRHGRTGQETFGVLDRLNMTYTGNRLRTLTEQAEVQHLSRTVDFQVENTEPIIGEEILMSQFEYDNNGNLTKDKSRGISSIRYNLLNLPSKLSISNSDGSATQHYLYSADGRKLRMTVLTPRDTLKREYVGNYIYENGSLKRILVDGGYIQDGEYCFFLTDHQGNTRVVAKADGTVLQTNHYYPYGLPFAEGIGDSDQPYKYNGKEFDPTCGLNLYDYGARFMDPTLGGRFTTPDPLAEKRHSISPYAYCGGNPVNRIDPDGKDWYLNNQTGELYYNEKYNDETVQFKGQTYNRVGDNTMMGDMEGVAISYYTYESAQEFASERGFGIEPAEQLIHIETSKSPCPTGKYNITIESGSHTIINSNYKVISANEQMEITQSETLYFKAGQSWKETMSGGQHKIHTYRNYYAPVNKKRMNRIIGNVIKYGAAIMLGQHDYTDTKIYSSWNLYDKSTKGMGPLLEYRY